MTYPVIVGGFEGAMEGVNEMLERDKKRKESTIADELAATRERLIRAQAAGHAQQSLANTMVDELKAEQAGDANARRLSAPGNRDARVCHVINVENEHLQRLSGGRLSIEAELLAKAKAIEKAQKASAGPAAEKAPPIEPWIRSKYRK